LKYIFQTENEESFPIHCRTHYALPFRFDAAANVMDKERITGSTKQV